MDTIRIFIGTEPKAEIARKVLEHSIRRYTANPVEFTPMIGGRWEYRTTGLTQGTGFSLRRWMIPEYCNWQGRAIYLDADQLVFSDIKELWEMPDKHPDPHASVWCTYQKDKYNKQPAPQTAVMVIDCARARDEGGWRLDLVLPYLAGPDVTRETYAKLMHCEAPTSRTDKRVWWTRAAPVKIGVEWNSLNVYAKGKTKLLHYTKEPEQPWYKHDHPHAGIWREALRLAYKAGHVTEVEIREAVARFGVKQDWRTTNGLHPSYLSVLS